MFSWFRRRPPAPTLRPGISESDPGTLTHIVSSGPDDPQSKRVELDAADVLARVLQDASQRCARRDVWFLTSEGLMIQPGIVSIEKPTDGPWHVVSTIETRFAHGGNHAVWGYQDGFGETLPAATAHGFQSWVDTDLPVLIDASRKKPLRCTLVEIPFPATDSRPARKRRVVLGPPLRTVTKPSLVDASDAHPFCACCMFTRLRDGLGDRLNDGKTHGIRFYAFRAADGSCSADCRINGIDWPEGIAALKAYAASWTDQGDEVRKQYVIILSAL